MWSWLASLVLSIGLASAGGPVARASEEPMASPPAIEAPAGGWYEVDGIYARVLGTDGDRATVRRLADHAAAAVPRLSRALGVPAGTRMDVYVAPAEQFGAIQPGEPPDWADGTAWPTQGLVFLHSPGDRPGTAEALETVLDHEIVHVLLGRAFAPERPPRWLQEGMAQLYAGEITPALSDTLAQARLGGGLLPLATLVRGFPADAGLARLAYAQSADFVGWIGSTYGDDALRRLVAELDGGATAEQAVRDVTGKSLAQIEVDWSSRWDSPWRWVQGLLGSGILWGFFSLLIVVGAWRRRRRGKLRLALWEAEEERARLLAQQALRDRLEMDARPVTRGQVIEFRGPVQ